MAGGLSFDDLQVVIDRLRENHRYCVLSYATTRRYDLQQQLRGRVAAYEVALRLLGVHVESQLSDCRSD